MILKKEHKKIIEYLSDEYKQNNKEYLSVKDIHINFKDISYFKIRLILIELLENKYIESLKIGNKYNYYRAFRINLEPDSPGVCFYVSRNNIKNIEKK